MCKEYINNEKKASMVAQFAAETTLLEEPRRCLILRGMWKKGVEKGAYSWRCVKKKKKNSRISHGADQLGIT
jgi:hypothetical protein